MTLDALIRQVGGDSEILLVSTFNDVTTKKFVLERKGKMNIRVVKQKKLGLMQAYREGIRESRGEIIIFLDDDSVPLPNLITEHVKMYNITEVAGVSGGVIPANYSNKDFRLAKDPGIFSSKENKFVKILKNQFNRPIKGQDNYLTYISKAGYVGQRQNVDKSRICQSLFYLGANMSIRASIQKVIDIPKFLERGLSFEQIVGWQLWKKGYKMVYNPRARVYHLMHGQTMSRSLGTKAYTQASTDRQLLFYYLFGREKDLSIISRVIALLFDCIVNLRDKDRNWKTKQAILNGIFSGNLIGVRFLISRNRLKPEEELLDNDLLFNLRSRSRHK